MHKTIVIAGLALGFGATAAFAGPPVPRDQALKLMARPGSWLEADGALQPDGTLLAKDLEIYAPGDTVDCEEPAIYGMVAKLDRARSSMRVLTYAVVWDVNTTIKDENKRKILSSKVEEGMGVKVQGSLQPNGTYKATKIRAHANKDKSGKVKAKEKIFGPVTVTDARSGTLRILNTTIKLREDASFQEAVVGQQNQ